MRQLNLSPEEHLSFSDEKGDIDKAKRPWDFLPSGHRIGKPEPLFKELVGITNCSVFHHSLCTLLYRIIKLFK